MIKWMVFQLKLVADDVWNGDIDNPKIMTKVILVEVICRGSTDRCFKNQEEQKSLNLVFIDFL